MEEVEVPVLIVGGGPVGLSASLLLSRHGVRSLLVERHAGTSNHPKARGLNVRTLELFRTWGLEEAVRAAAGDLAGAMDVVWAPTMVAPETRRMPYGGAGERQSTDSPTTSADCYQHKLELVLLEAARSLGLGELRFGQELMELSQDRDGVTATVVDRVSGEQTVVRADWMVAADGAHSTIRSLLGIEMVGPGVLFRRVGIYFRADLRAIWTSRPAFMYLVSPPEGGGPIGPVNPPDLWRYMAPFRPERGERAEDFDEDRCVRMVRAAVGIPDLAVEVLSALPWSNETAVAGRFRDGRVFLAGDAAHLMHQTLSAGIQDVHNLAWKLAAHLNGWAGAGLLDTYEAERRPFALAVSDDSAQNNAATRATGTQRLEHFSNRGRALGISYDSSAVVPDGTDPPAVANPVVDYVPCARPGSRAPHLWLEHAGRQISTLDLFDTDFVLLTGPAGEAWQVAAGHIAERLRVPLRYYTIGPDGPLIGETGAWQGLYGIEPEGAVLVRPDGHVAWRSPYADASPASRLADALGRILSRD